MRRFAFAMLVFLVVLSVVVAFLVEVITSWLGGRPSFALSAVLTILILVLVAGGASRLFRRGAGAVSDLVEAAARVESGDFAARVEERGPREVRSLGRAFNAMSARLEETDASRRRLLADVSHELRTPLTIMQGTLEGMLDGLYPIDEAHLAPVLEETRVLARLVEDLRTLSLSEAGSLRLHPEPTDLALLLGEVAAAHRLAADAAGVALTLDAAADLPTVEVDPARIRQVVGNLIANALRFTAAGGRITVSTARTDAGVRVAVRDDGAGMEPEALEHAFDRFYRSPTSPGSGLGLSIARNLVEAHGGRIEIDSMPGQGTVVTFTLPTASPRASPSAVRP